MRSAANSCWVRQAALLSALFLLAGCLTSRPVVDGSAEDKTLTPAEVQAFYQRARDPRRFFLTVYDSDSGPVFSGDFRTHPNQYCTLPFLSPQGSAAPVVAFRGRSPDDFRALVDTSASEVWASLPAALAIGASPLKSPAYRLYPAHVTNSVPGFLCAGEKFRLDQVHLETPLVFARAARGSLGPLRRGLPDVQFVFGMRMLKVFRTVQFDFPRRELLLATVNPYKPDPERLVATVPYSLGAGALCVRGTINGKPTSFILDSAGTFGLVRAGGDGTPIGHVSIGDLVFRDLVPGDPAALGLGMTDLPRIGLDLLARYRVTLDTQRSVVQFELPEET